MRNEFIGKFFFAQKIKLLVDYENIHYTSVPGVTDGMVGDFPVGITVHNKQQRWVLEI